MKNKLLICFIFAAFGLAMQGCGPETKILGLVWEDQAGTPVPDTAVLAMIWLEDADKALEKPAFDKAAPEKRTSVMDRDMEKRGRPSAYARGFTDKYGRFELAKFHFSAKTRKKAKELKNPVVSRMTVIAFARGYLKTAATMFPENDDDRASPVMLYIGKPKDWYDLYGQNTAETLTQEYMRNAYSVDFGATKEEKAWMLAYTQGNLWKAYTESDIKGDKRRESSCGRDYSDVIISSAGMQRNPAREKCADILREMGVVRHIKDNWMTYHLANKSWTATVKELAKAAIAALPAEYNEPKLYQAGILSGIEESEKAENAVDVEKTGYRNGLSGTKPEKKAALAEAQGLYNVGDRAGAYKAVGATIYRAISAAVPDHDARIELGAISGQIKGGAAIVSGNAGATLTEIENSLATAGNVSAEELLAGIGRTLGGFHLLMNRPQTAAAPGGDDGDHRDKPEVKGSTETIAAYNVPIEEYVPRVIIEGKWGTGPGEFGVAWTDANDINVPQSPSGSKSMPIYPSSLAVDGKGNIYVLDMVNNRIQKFDPQGIFLKTLDVESYMGEEQPIWYGKVKTEDGREILDKVDSKDKSGNTTGTDKWFPFYWPITVQGINIVIDSKDTLYYYLKRMKDGKETGEVWEFKKDKLVMKTEVPADGGVYYEAPLGLSLEEDDSIWIFNARENGKKTNKHYEILGKKRYTTKERDEKLVKARETNKGQKNIRITPLDRLRELDLQVRKDGIVIIREHRGK